jgi:hypothetical protein
MNGARHRQSTRTYQGGDMQRGSAPDVACPGCMGDRRCWVCLGTGRLRTRQGVSLPCHVCRGSGACAKCGQNRADAPAPLADLLPPPRPSTEIVTDVPAVRTVAG